MTRPRLVRFSVQLTALEYQDLKREAADRGPHVTVSYLAREAIRNRHILAKGKVGGELHRRQGQSQDRMRG